MHHATSESLSTSPRLRGLRYALASLFVIWHAAAIMIAPAPRSYIKEQIYPWFAPYLTLFYLDNPWAFFAPDPATGRLLRYTLEDAAGQKQDFLLSEALSRLDPASLRYVSLYLSIADKKPGYVDSAAKYLCRQHAALKPHAVAFTVAHQVYIPPIAYRSGVRPLHNGFVHYEFLPPVECTP